MVRNTREQKYVREQGLSNTAKLERGSNLSSGLRPYVVVIVRRGRTDCGVGPTMGSDK